jgi:uncharacterized protein YqeY
MSILAEIKSRITAALRSGNVLEKNTLRVVLGDVQTRAATLGVDPNDDLVNEVMKRHVASMKETIPLAKGDGRDTTQLEKELKLLTSLLPESWSQDTIASFLQDTADPLVEQIKKASNDGQAMGVAMKFLRAERAPVEASDVRVVVSKLRKH